MKRTFFFFFALTILFSSHAQNNNLPYHIADIQVMYDVMRQNPNTTTEMLFRNRHSTFSLDLDVYHQFKEKQTTISADLGYTFFFRAKLGGWGLHAGWKGAYVPTNATHKDFVLISHYLVGPEYMVFTQRGNAFNFRWLGGWFSENYTSGGPGFAFQFDWDIPNLFGLQGLSFLGKYELLIGTDYSFESTTEAYKINPFSSHGEVTMLYTFINKSDNHWQGRNKLGVFSKLLFTSNYPLGWHSGDDYYKNYGGSLTLCIGLLYEF